MTKTKKLLIFGTSSFAEVVYEYFQFDSEYEVAAFVVERAHIESEEMFGLPVVPFEDLPASYPPGEYNVFVAIVYTKLNRLRTRFVSECKKRGYTLARYVSPQAFVWRNVTLGEHIFIFENNVIQPFCEIGDNVILWSGNHIGHHSKIGDNCFVASHAVISGHCDIGENSFVGVNATIANDVAIGKDCWLAPNSLVSKSCDENQFLLSPKTETHRVSPRRFFKVEE